MVPASYANWTTAVQFAARPQREPAPARHPLMEGGQPVWPPCHLESPKALGVHGSEPLLVDVLADALPLPPASFLIETEVNPSVDAGVVHVVDNALEGGVVEHHAGLEKVMSWPEGPYTRWSTSAAAELAVPWFDG